MIDVLDREIKLIFMPLWVAAEFASTIRQHAHQLRVVIFEQRDHAVVEQICCRNRRLAIIQFGAYNLAVGVHEGLLVDAPDA